VASDPSKIEYYVVENKKNRNKTMASLINALDSFTATRQGENGHVELDWSNDIKEKIVQFDFQCVRTTREGVNKLYIILSDILRQLSTKQSNDEVREELLTVLYKIIFMTRDVEGGKGEYTLSYMMVWAWYPYYPNLAKQALESFVLPTDDEIPYGSWKDIKYFCDFIRDRGATPSHDLIKFCISIVNRQIREDAAKKEDVQLSLVAKWIPREKSKFGWLYNHLAFDYFQEYIASATDDTRARAEKKCITQYRILCSTLNRRLDTVQIKQAGRNWSAIDHAKTTSITMAKNRRAFMNLKPGRREERRSDHEDRINCATNLLEYMEKLKKEGKEVNGKNMGLEMFTKQAYRLLLHVNRDEIDILNSQWRDNGNKKNAGGLGNMIAIVDTSGSMHGTPFDAAIALGCRVAEKSILGKRIMTFSSEPTWLNLEGCETFTDMFNVIYNNRDKAGLNTDFYKALDMILASIEEKRVSPEVVANMTLAIFSDMQIDDNIAITYNNVSSARDKWATMFGQIKNKYAEVGMRMYGTPLTPPHILFWNLRQTDGFPTISTESNCSMMSGYDPSLLNMFCDVGMEAIKDLTPYNALLKRGNLRFPQRPLFGLKVEVAL